MPGIVLGAGDVAVNETEPVPVSMELTQWVQLSRLRTPNVKEANLLRASPSWSHSKAFNLVSIDATIFPFTLVFHQFM